MDVAQPEWIVVNVYGDDDTLARVRQLDLDIVPPNEGRAPDRANMLGAIIAPQQIASIVVLGAEVHVLSSSDQMEPLTIAHDARAWLEAVTGTKY